MRLLQTIADLRSRLSQPEDGAALAVFRVGFGLVMCYDMIRYCWRLDIPGRYQLTDFHFKYFGFEWVQAPPGDGMYWQLSILAVLALMIALGWFYRWVTVLFTLGFAWFFLIDRAQYLNHFYMVLLFSCLMCLVPAHRMWSLDVHWGRVLRSPFSPVWARWILLLQLEIILIYAGIVKLNPDWLNLAPLDQWLAKRDDMPIAGALFTQRWAVGLAAYGVIALHLVGAPLLLWKRTRVYVLWIYAGFHSLNHFVFTIGIFPWFTLFASLLCLDSDWPRQFWRRLAGTLNRYQPLPAGTPTMMQPLGKPLMALLAAWLFVQMTLPLRHWVYDGDVAWNDDGHTFSWRMKLRSQRGKLRYLVHDQASSQRWAVVPDDYLTSKQVRKLACRPDMILQFGHYLSRRFAEDMDIAPPAVYAQNRCSLNYREYAPQVDPSVDLTTIKRSDSMNLWILPLQEQLPNRIIPWSRVPGPG